MDHPDLTTCQYKIVDILGKHEDKVYQVTDLKDGKQYALKILGSNKHGPINPYEIDIASKMRHPNIMPFTKHVDISTCNPQLKGIGLRMDLAERTLFHIANGKLPMGYRDKLSYIYQTLHGVKFMHDNGYIHLDLKPENVFLQTVHDPLQRRIPRVADFGFARRVTNIHVGIVMGLSLVTPAYRPPEAYNAINDSYHIYNAKSDIWTIGHLMVSVLCSAYLFSSIKPEDKNKPSVTKEYLNKDFINPVFREQLIRQVSSRIDPKLTAVLMKAFEFDPNKRPTIDELMADPLFDQVRTPMPQGQIVYTDRFSKKSPLETGNEVLEIYKYLYVNYESQDSRLFFMAIDIYYRIVARMDLSTATIQDSISIKKVLSAVSIWISSKCLFGYIEGIFDGLVKWCIETTNSSLDTATMSAYLDHMEVWTYTCLAGDIDSPYVYDVCNTAEDLRYMFKNVVTNPNIYNVLTASQIKTMILPNIGNDKFSATIKSLSA